MLIAEFFFILGMILIPENGIKGLGVLGELANEMSAYPFMLAIGLVFFFAVVKELSALRTQPKTRTNGSPIYFILGGILLVTLMSVLMNISDIAIANFHARSGFAKLASSTMVLMYGMCLAVATYILVPGKWNTLIIRPIAISVVLSLLYSSLEIMAHHGILSAFYTKIEHFMHSNSNNLTIKWNGKVNLKVAAGWDTRIRSLCFEPPYFGYYAGLAWPWLIAGVLTNKGLERRIYAIVLALFTLLILIAKARTGWLMLAANIATLAALYFIYLPPVRTKYNRQLGMGLIAAGAVLVVCASVYYVVDFAHIRDKIISGTSVSNLSRMASQVSAVNMFKDHVLFGVGFGQYGFHVTQYMPSWGYLSYELRPWLIYPTAPWPSVYSRYARLAAEEGIVGLAGWIAVWIYMIVITIKKSRQFLHAHGKLPSMAYPLVVSYVSVLVSGLVYDTFASAMIWIPLGLGCAYLNHLNLPRDEGAKVVALKPARPGLPRKLK